MSPNKLEFHNLILHSNIISSSILFCQLFYP